MSLYPHPRSPRVSFQVGSSALLGADVRVVASVTINDSPEAAVEGGAPHLSGAALYLGVGLLKATLV